MCLLDLLLKEKKLVEEYEICKDKNDINKAKTLMALIKVRMEIKDYIDNNYI